MIGIKIVKPDNLWYIIGFITADGNLSKDGRHIEITSKDESLLVLIKQALNLTNKIGKKCRGGSRLKIYPYFSFGDVRFYKFLLELVCL